MPPASATATSGVAPSDAGVPSALVNTMQQLGGAVGTSLLSSVFAGAVAGHLADRERSGDALEAASVHGCTVAFWVAAGIFAVGSLTVTALIRPHRRADTPLPPPPARRRVPA